LPAPRGFSSCDHTHKGRREGERKRESEREREAWMMDGRREGDRKRGGREGEQMLTDD
jgi:hypothetical protein